MADYLTPLPEKRVAAWYRRLAQRWAKETIDGEPALAPLLLNHWLDNRDAKSVFEFEAPTHLRESHYVKDVLARHRAIFLSRMPAHTGRTVGVLPRLRSGTAFQHWDLKGPLEMHYHSLVEVGSGLADIVAIKYSGSKADRDLLTALRGFQLHSRIRMTGERNEARRCYSVRTVSWWAHIEDRYDFDYSEYFTVPNPDYRSTARDAIRPGDEKIRVHHSNARRLERAGLAAPYDVKSKPWQVTGNTLLDARADYRFSEVE